MTVHLSNRSPLPPWDRLGAACPPCKRDDGGAPHFLYISLSFGWLFVMFFCSSLFVCLFIVGLFVHLAREIMVVPRFFCIFCLFVCLLLSYLSTLQGILWWCPALPLQQQSPPSQRKTQASSKYEVGSGWQTIKEFKCCHGYRVYWRTHQLHNVCN